MKNKKLIISGVLVLLVAFSALGPKLYAEAVGAVAYISAQMESAIITAPAVSVSDTSASNGGVIKFGTPVASFYDSVCAGKAVVTSPSTVQGSLLNEISGVASSREADNVYWVHNDSGDTARVFAINGAGATLGIFNITGAGAYDWEDIATGPGPVSGENYIYIADFGDNAMSRADIRIYRIPEPTANIGGGTASVSGVVTLKLQYPDGPRNAEGFFVDPLNGDMYIVQKTDTSVAGVYRIPANTPADTLTTMQKITEVQYLSSGGGFHLVTGADMAPDGKSIAIRTPTRVWIHNRVGNASIATALATATCQPPQYTEVQGEAIGYKRNSMGLVSISEGLNRAIFNIDIAP